MAFLSKSTDRSYYSYADPEDAQILERDPSHARSTPTSLQHQPTASGAQLTQQTASYDTPIRTVLCGNKSSLPVLSHNNEVKHPQEKLTKQRSTMSSPTTPTCSIDRDVLNENTVGQMDDLGLQFFAKLCGANRGAFVLDPPDGKTYG